MRYISKKINKEVSEQIKGLEVVTYEEIAPVDGARRDYEGYSTILISRVDRNGKYYEVVLEDVNKIQRLANPLEYFVLVDRSTDVENYYASGRLIRKDVVFDEGATKQAKDTNFGVL